jgi:ABC-type transporter Mla MlaB component
MDGPHRRAHAETVDLALEVSAYLIPVAGTFVIAGELDAPSSTALAPDLRAAVDRYLDPDHHRGIRPATIRVDLRRLKRLSASGANLLQNVAEQAGRAGARTTVIVASGSDPQRVLELVETGHRMDIEVTPPAGRAAAS